jgi:hypothetical protein
MKFCVSQQIIQRLRQHIRVTTFRKFIAPQTPTARRIDRVYHISRRAGQQDFSQNIVEFR